MRRGVCLIATGLLAISAGASLPAPGLTHGGNSLPPHAEVLAEGASRSTHDGRASFETAASRLPQDDAGGSFEPSPDSQVPPRRIVSLNLCTDELLLRLVDRDRIASVTWLSQDPRSANLAAEARTVPANHGLAEEVLALRPDLVVAGRYTTRTTVALLRRAGVSVVEFDMPSDLAEVAAQIRDFAALVGEPARGEAVLSEMERRLALLRARPREGRRPAALVLRPNGFTAGRGSLVDDILTRAGLDNLAARLDLGDDGQVPLETAVLEKADLLVVDTDPDGPPSLATAILQHPVLARLKGRIASVSLPSRLWTCAGPSVVEAIERLAAAPVRSGGP